MKLKTIVGSLMLLGLASHALAQAPAQRITITGSSIKRIQTEGALPVQTISRAELDKQGILSAEQLISALSVNGTGLDNLASNGDVVANGQRGNNGATSANLRSQGANATLVLLNGRRVASHGLNGGVVDLNQIPFSAVERVEILKDGASSVYGTDAVGGVINFIMRTDFAGLIANVTADTTQHSGGNIYRASLVGGLGNLDSDRYNLLATLSVSDSKKLSGSDRDFVNTLQPERGLSPDTRGTPYATLFTLSTLKTVLTRPGSTNGTGPLLAGTTTALNGINTLDLPGGAGCASQPNMGPYEEKIWAAGAAASYGCTWDTGRSAVIQQPVKNTNLVTRGTFKLGEHQLIGEIVFGRSESAKSFSESQVSTSATATTLLYDGKTLGANPLFNLAYPSTGVGYASVFNALVATFPELAPNQGSPMGLRWRCMECGRRELQTQTDTGRILLAAEGPFMAGWDYRAGISSAYSKSNSTLGNGYYYSTPFANLINTGVLNPFLLSGQTQTPAALAALEAISARGVRLYDGKFTMDEIDATVSGPIYKLPGGEVLAAVGVDFRTEKYKFNGDDRAGLNTVNTLILNAAFDNINALNGVKRDIKAVYGEVILPVVKSLELTLSARHDEYSGFGGTNNPKVSLRFAPLDSFLMRGSYSTGFRVPTFNQLYNGITVSPIATGAGNVDPDKCPSLKVDATPGSPCNAVAFSTLFGGKDDLGPEKAKMASVGAVWQPVTEFSASLDWWDIKREGTIQSFGLSTIMANYLLFPNNFIRDGSGNLVAVDTRWVNAGETRTQGLELSLRANTALMGARISGGLDGSYMIEKKSRLLVNSPFGPSEIGVFTRSTDLGIRWRHSAFVTYTRGEWSSTFSQRFASGYAGYVPPGVANGSITPSQWDPLVKSYSLYNLTFAYTGVKNLTLGFGIKNLLDTDPPFANSYDTNTGAGSSWEPRIADPRGRSFLLSAEYKFF